MRSNSQRTGEERKMNWSYYLRHLEGGCLSNVIPRILSHLYCFLFGHRVPCGTGGGLCDRCYKSMTLNRNKDGSFNVDGGLLNPWAFSICDNIILPLYYRAKYKRVKKMVMQYGKR